MVTFASQPLSVLPEPLDYDEKTVVRQLIKTMSEIEQPITLIIRLHPREDSDNFLELLSSVGSLTQLKIVVDETTPPYSLIAASDAVIGMSSMMLTEAYLMGKPVLSVRPGHKAGGNDPIALSTQGQVKTVSDSSEFLPAIEQLLIAKSAKGSKIPDTIDAVGRILAFISNQLK